MNDFVATDVDFDVVDDAEEQEEERKRRKKIQNRRDRTSDLGLYRSAFILVVDI